MTNDLKCGQEFTNCPVLISTLGLMSVLSAESSSRKLSIRHALIVRANPMSERDEYDERAERLLPCSHCSRDSHIFMVGGVCCPAIYRPAVAAELRAVGTREAGLEKQVIDLEQRLAAMLKDNGELSCVIADLRREVEGLKTYQDESLQIIAEQITEIANLRREVERLKEANDNYVVQLTEPEFGLARANMELRQEVRALKAKLGGGSC